MKVSQQCWLVLMAEDPSTAKKKYFVDKCLPFGSSISCAQFQKFSDALQFITEFKLQVTLRITNYLDDFLFVARMIWICDHMMSQFLAICEDIGCPVSEEKTEWGSDCMIFLGTLLDGNELCLATSEEKKNKATQQLLTIVHKKKVKVHDLQSLTGLLNFLTRAIIPGRVFTCRLFTKIPSYIYSMQQKKLKFFHHVRVDAEFRNDCQMWLTFLQNADENKSLLCRPFIDFDATKKTMQELSFYTDPTKN